MLTHSSSGQVGRSSRSFLEQGERKGFYSSSNPRETTSIWRYGNLLDVPVDCKRARLESNVNSEVNNRAIINYDIEFL